MKWSLRFTHKAEGFIADDKVHESHTDAKIVT